MWKTRSGFSVICGIPGNKLPELTFWQWLKPDKVTHLVVFGVQSYLLLKAFYGEGAPLFLRNHAVLWALVLTIGYGVLTEVLQTYVFIKRYGDVRDALANAAAADNDDAACEVDPARVGW